MQASEVGAEIGSFIGNIFNPVLGGTTTQTTTEQPSNSSSTTTLVILVVVVAFVAAMAYFLFKQKSN